MKNKTYYFPNPEDESAFFGSEYPICVDFAEVKRLANEWGYGSVGVLMDQLHEATEAEITKYGTYDTPTE